ncbi:MAG: penicillin-binding transpeptidase domain-containing protein, partial [Acidimicrobiia bacterium]
TGAVLVMASGLTFDQTQFDLAIQGRRNPGSAFKPFGLVAALESGITLASYWDGRSPKEIECPQYCTPPEWLVHNAAGSTGLTSLDTATSSSINVVFAQVAVAVGPDAISEVAHRMGITSDLGSAEHAPSLVLGAGAVTTLEMASAFSTFATNGLHAKPYLISRIVAGDGEVIYEHQPEVAQVVDPAVIAAARQPLTRVPTGGGTAPRANIDRPQGGKTGTHQTYQDAWYVGFVPQYSTAVWVGFKDFQLSLRNVTINGETYSRVFGGTVPAPIWAEFMAYMLQGVPGAEFPDDPQGTSAYFRPAETTVPSVVGMDEGEAINELYDAHLNVSVEEVGSLEPEGTVVGQSIEPGAEVNQGTTVAIQVASGEPPSAPLLDLVGQTLDQALASISEFEEETEVFLDYKIQYVKVDDPSQDDVVLSTDPPPGSEVVHGQSVELRVGEFEEQGEGKGPPGGDD